MPLLRYIFDPFCGWCYGSAPLLHAASPLPELSIELHGGGMMMGARRQPVTAALRDFVTEHDRRIAAMSGQPFGVAYTEGLLRDASAVFDSEPPTTAILAASRFGKTLPMLERIQTAHFIEGRRIADAEVLFELAENIGIDRRAFDEMFTACSGAATAEHIAQSRALLGQVNGEGFPTFILEKDGQFQKLPATQYLGRPDAWVRFLESIL